LTDTDHPSPARHANGRFGPGNPGRPPGARGRASHKVVMSILEDFEANKARTLEFLRTCRAESYFATLLRLLPPLIEDEAPPPTCSDAEAAAKVTRARVVLGGGMGPREALAELQAVLADAP
jgi:hypothetical protein